MPSETEEQEMVYQNKKVLGYITIPKLNIEYPIINYENEQSLNQSVCKYRGPELNEIGNLVLLGHRTRNGLFFTRLHELETEDTIIITKLNGSFQEYEVTDYKKIDPTYLEVLKEEESKKKLTLITCTTDNKMRYVINAEIKE